MGEKYIDLARLEVLLDAYGADRTRWPEDERAGAWAFIESADQARALYEEARALDGLLAQATTFEPSPELKAAILTEATAPRGQGSWIAGLWPFGAAWKPASALAAAIMLGIIAGVVLPSPFNGNEQPLDGEIGDLAMQTVFEQDGEQ